MDKLPVKTIHLVHGFNVSDDGEGTINKLAPHICKNDKNTETKIFSYGWLGLIGVFFLNPFFVKKLIPLVKKGDIGIAHSNGAVLLLMANTYGAPFGHLIFISPALMSDIYIHDNIKKVSVFHTDNDDAVRVGRLLRQLIPWAPLGDPLWGDMGAVGHIPKNKRIKININFLDKLINLFNKSKPSLLVFRLLIGVPIGLSYWIFVGPIEYSVFLFHNYFKTSESSNRVGFKEREHVFFFLCSFVLPLLTISLLI